MSSVKLIPNKNKTITVSFFDPCTNSRIRKSFSSFKLASQYKKEIEDTHFNTRITYPTTESFSKLLSHYRDIHGINRNLIPACHFHDLQASFSSFKTSDITTDALECWLEQIKSENDLSETSLNKIKAGLNKIFNFLIELGAINKSPSEAIERTRISYNQSKRKILSLDEVSHALVDAKTKSPGQIYPILLLLSNCALKTCEILDLKWSQVDLPNSIITLPKRSQVNARVLKINPFVTSILLQLKKHQKRKNLHVFLNWDNKPFNKNKLTRLIRSYFREFNLETKWSPREFRYTYAYEYLRTGGSMNKLSYILGHKSVMTTRELYSYVDIEVSNRANHEHDCFFLGHQGGLGILSAEDRVGNGV